MSIHKPHELHKRRSGRNVALGLVLVAFATLVFGLTVVKVTEGNVGQAIAGAARK